MTAQTKNRPYRDMEQFLGNLLRIGVILAGVIVLVGGLFYLLENGHGYADYSKFRGEPEDLRHVHDIIYNAVSFRRLAIIQLGILLLIATPIARVIFSIYAFARDRDFIYVTVTIIVLAILIFGLAGGHL